MQDNSEEYLKLISRLSSVKKEDRTESGRSWEKLSQFLNTEAAAVIEDSTYPKKAVSARAVSVWKTCSWRAWGKSSLGGSIFSSPTS